MKTILLTILLLVPALVWAEKPAPNPADYTITVHVRSSRWTWSCFNSGGQPPALCGVQPLTVLVDGIKYELEGHAADLLRVGDYKAKIDKDETKRPYEYQRVYEFLFPDGTTRKYTVVGE